MNMRWRSPRGFAPIGSWRFKLCECLKGFRLGKLPTERVPKKRKASRNSRGLESKWCPEPESNQRHVDFQSTALPTELSGQVSSCLYANAPSLSRIKKAEILSLAIGAGMCLNFFRCFSRKVARCARFALFFLAFPFGTAFLGRLPGGKVYRRKHQADKFTDQPTMGRRYRVSHGFPFLGKRIGTGRRETSGGLSAFRHVPEGSKQ